ncbi:MAG: hypothetical protein II877_06910, partial [Synergistaceae bacterium]|nr:hypothetical protein [Synergistaceae bacterium]
MKKCIALFMAVCLLGVCPCAWADYWNEGHSGTEADPYVIDTNADLEALRDRVNAGTESGDKYYKMTQNLNISQITDWESIGTDKNPFTGHFDGNNLAVQLNIVDKAYNATSGLFGRVATADDTYAIKKLGVSGAVKGRYSGGIILRLDSGNVEGCSFNGTIQDTYDWSGGSGMGGIVAAMTGGSIVNCTSSANVELPSGNEECCAGGIVGAAQVATFEAIKDCTFSGNVTGNHYAGGIVGHVSGGNLQNNSVTGNPNGQAVISSTYLAGGIAGRIGDSAVLESCD